MAKKPLSFVVIKYQGRDTAKQALDGVKELAKQKQVVLKDAAAVYKNDKGKVKLHQTKDVGGGAGTVYGGLAGLIVAIFTGGWLPLMIAGGAVGGVWAWLGDPGIKNKTMKALGEDMEITESALCLLIEQANWEVLSSTPDPYNGEVVVANLTDEAVDALEKASEQKEVVEAVEEELV